VTDDDLVYSADRISRLRMVLWVVAGVGVLLALTAIYTVVALVPDDDSLVVVGVVLALAATSLLGTTGIAVRVLPERGRPARRACVAIGLLLVAFGVVMSSIWIGVVMLLLGLVVLFLALLSDDPEAQ
jgi:hypothetical protein